MKRQIMTMLLAFVASVCTFAQSTSETGAFAGKKIGFIGDSYVYNHRRPQSETWHYKFAAKYGMEYLNYGHNGDRVASDQRANSPALYKRYDKMDPNLDYVVIIAGHNDANHLEEDGGIEGFMDKADVLLKGIKAHCPKAKIMWVTPWRGGNKEVKNNFKLVIKAIKKVCKRNDVPVLDASKTKIDPSDANFRKLYFQRADDTAHLNDKGHNLFLPISEKFLLKHMK